MDSRDIHGDIPCCKNRSRAIQSGIASFIDERFDCDHRIDRTGSTTTCSINTKLLVGSEQHKIRLFVGWGRQSWSCCRQMFQKVIAIAIACGKVLVRADGSDE
jgi:hypothetical protein